MIVDSSIGAKWFNVTYVIYVNSVDRLIASSIGVCVRDRWEIFQMLQAWGGPHDCLIKKKILVKKSRVLKNVLATFKWSIENTFGNKE